MALSRKLAEFTYKSTVGLTEYFFNVTVDEQSLVAVRNILTPNGPILDSYTSLPESVVDDISAAKALVEDLIAESTLASGTAAFDDDVSSDVVFVSEMNNTNYRVVYSADPDVAVATINKAITGFTISTSAAYTGDIGYTVLAKTSQSSATGGVLSFTVDTGSSVEVTFSTAYSSDSYRVVLTTDGFYPAKVTNKTTTGFTVELAIGLSGDQTASVGYEVFA
jgi:hypothetical protein